MKLALDLRCVRPWPTGTGRYTWNLLEALLEQEAVIWGILHRRESPGELPPALRPIWTDCGIEDHLRGEPWRHLWLPGRLRARGIQVFHAPAGFLPWNSGGARRIVTIHDLALHRYPATNSWRFGAYMRAAVQLAVMRAHHILTVSEFVRAELLERFRLSEDRVEAVHHGIDPAWSEAGELRPDERRRLELERPYVLTVANREPRKNLARLLQAWSLLPERLTAEHRLVLVGGQGWQGRGFRRALERLPADRRPQMPGVVPETLLRRLYASARVFVLPSLYEGFGLPALEAMATGCPCLLARAASLPEVGGPAAEYFDPLDAEELGHRLARLLEDPERRRRLSTAGRERAAGFTWAEAARRTREAYRRTL